MKSVAIVGRAGFVLPVVLVCGLLGISMVVTFQFISSSDYKQVGRLMRSVQATALADLASDEVAAKINAIKWNEPRTGWVKGLLEDLDGSKAAGTINVTRDLGDLLSECPVTTAQASKSGLVKVGSVKGVAGPFQVLPAGGIDQAFVYKEELYGDGSKDVTAWDLRGPVSLEIKIAGENGPLAFDRVYRRGQTLAITDTTPPGRDFAAMAYLPPFSADYAVQDMQKGGTYNLTPGAGRLMFRGPLVIAPEEADPLPAFPDKPHMGGADPIVAGVGASPTYPDAKYIGAFATVPGPRELQHPGSTNGSENGEINGVESSLLDVKDDMTSRRPGGEKSDSTLRTQPTPMTITLKTYLGGVCPSEVTKEFTIPALTFVLGPISPVLSKGLDTASPSFDTIDKEPLAFFPPLAYFYAPLPKGQQKFKILPNTPSQLGPGSYSKGVKAAAGGASAALFTTPDGAAEGDAVVTEPVPKTGGNAQDSVGLIGVYGVAVAESRTYAKMEILDVARWLTQKAIDKDPKGDERIGLAAAILCGDNPTRREIAQKNKESIANQAITQLGLDPATTFLVRRYQVEGGLTMGGAMTASALAGQLSAKKGAIAPFGSYFHAENFWNSGAVNGAAKDAIKKGLTEPKFNPADAAGKEALLNQLLPESGGSQVASLDPGWPDGGTEGKIVRDFLCDEYAKKLLAATPAAGSGDPGAALNALTAVASKVRGIAEPRVALKPRPQGAFGPHAGAPAEPLADKAELAGLYPRGTMPSKARDWESMATRSYETFDEYYAAERNGSTLELRGAVLIKSCSTSQNIQYSGRGIIILVTSDAGNAAKLGGTVTPVDAKSWLTVVHRVKPGLVTGTPPALQLGSVFKGTVLSETGVKPAGGQITLDGSLITGLLNKGASSDGDTIGVTYAPDTDGATMPMAWTVEASGEVFSTDPEP